MELSDLTIESKTQTAEQIKAALESAGYETTGAEVTTDAPKEDPAAPAESTQAGAAAPTGSSIPSTDAGGATAAGAGGGEKTEAEQEAARAAQEQTQPKHTGSARQKKKIANLTAENERLAQEAETLRRQLAERSAGEKPAETKATDKPAETPAPAAEELKPKAKPNPDDFENGIYDPLFVEALTDWRFEERQRLQRESDRQQKERDEQARRAQSESEAKATAEADEKAANERWTKQITAVKATHPDFDAVINKEHAKPVSNNLMLAALRNLDEGAELIYWLGTHPEEAQRIQELTALKKGAPRSEIERKFAIAYREFAKINLPAPSEAGGDAGDEEEDEDAASPGSRETPATVAASAPAAPKTEQPKAAAATATATAEPKHTPPSIVGGRGGSRTTDPTRMSEKQLRELPPDEYRKAMELQGRR